MKSLLFLIFNLLLVPQYIYSLNDSIPGGKSVRIQEQYFRFKPGPQPVKHEITNLLLQTISEGNQQLRVFTQYSIKSKYCLKPVDVQGSLGVVMKISELSLDGDIYYRELPMREILIPDKLDLTIHIKDDTGKVLEDLRLHAWDWRFDDKEEKVILSDIAYSDQTTFLFEVVHLEFYYSEASLHRKKKWMEAIASYYEWDKHISSTMDLLDGLTFTNPQTVMLNEFTLCEAEVIYGQLLYAPFYQHLNLSKRDPRNIKGRTENLADQLQALREGFNRNISYVDSLLYEWALIEYEKGNTSKSKQLWERTLAYNPMHVPAHIALAEMELEEGLQEKAMNRLKSYMGRIKPASVWTDMALDFSSKMFEEQITSAKDLMEDGRYLDALKQLDVLEDFCMEIQLWVCPESLFETIQLAHTGMYNSYLSVARRAYQSANYAFAETYATSAGNYQMDFSVYIPDDSEVIELLTLVYKDYIQNAEDARLRNDFGMAENYLDRAMELCGMYPHIECYENLAGLSAEIKNQRAVATRLTMQYTLQVPKAKRDQLDEVSAKEMIVDQLAQGHLNAWAGRTADARNNLNLIMEYASYFDVRNDTLINMRIISLGDKIKDKECELDERDVLALLASAKRMMQHRFLMVALQEYQTAMEIHKNAEECEWRYEQEINDLSFIVDAAEYQNLINDAQSIFFKSGEHNHELFIEKYLKAESFYINKSLKEYQITHNDLINFVGNSTDISLIRATIVFFVDANNHSDAVYLLSVLKSRGEDERDMRALQEYAGEKAALYYHQKHPHIQPREYVRQITRHDNWFKYYVGSFIRNWPR